LEPGSVLIYSGRLLRTEQRRTTATSTSSARETAAVSGCVLDTGYRVGFLSETEPQFAANPPQLARHYPPGLQRLVGYDLMGTTMGYFGVRAPSGASSPLSLPVGTYRVVGRACD